MLFLTIEVMCAHGSPTFRAERLAEDLFHLELFGPTFPIGRQSEVTARDQVNVIRFEGHGALHNLSSRDFAWANFQVKQKAKCQPVQGMKRPWVCLFRGEMQEKSGAIFPLNCSGLSIKISGIDPNTSE